MKTIIILVLLSVSACYCNEDAKVVEQLGQLGGHLTDLANNLINVLLQTISGAVGK